MSGVMQLSVRRAAMSMAVTAMKSAKKWHLQQQKMAMGAQTAHSGRIVWGNAVELFGDEAIVGRSDVQIVQWKGPRSCGTHK